MQHIVEFAFSSFQKWGHIDPNRSGIGLTSKFVENVITGYLDKIKILIKSK